MSKQVRTRRGWVIPAAVASAAVVASLAMGTLGAYTATINGENNLAGSGTLTMSESLIVDGAPIETVDTADSENGDNSIDSDINRYGGNLAMAPGDSESTIVQIANTGEVAGTLSLQVGAAVSGAMDGDTFVEAEVQPEINLVDTLQVALENQDGVEIYSDSLAGFVSENHLVGGFAVDLQPGNAENFTFTISFPDGETGTDLDLMGQVVQQGLTWTLTSTGAAGEEPAV